MITIEGKQYREFRCPNCRKLLFYEYVYAGRIASVCPRCDTITTWDQRQLKTKENATVIPNEHTIELKLESEVK